MKLTSSSVESYSCMVRIYLEHGPEILKHYGNLTQARSKYTSTTFECTSSKVKTYLEHVRNIQRARSIRTSSTFENISSTVKTYFEYAPRKDLKRSRRMAPAQFKDTSSLIETYLEHCRKLLRARLKHTSSTNET